MIPVFCTYEGCPMEEEKRGGKCEHRLPFGQAIYGPEGAPCNRWICTPETPWDKDKGRAIHPWAKEVKNSQENGWPAGDTVKMECPICEIRWTMELPQ